MMKFFCDIFLYISFLFLFFSTLVLSYYKRNPHDAVFKRTVLIGDKEENVTDVLITMILFISSTFFTLSFILRIIIAFTS